MHHDHVDYAASVLVSSKYLRILAKLIYGPQSRWSCTAWAIRFSGLVFDRVGRRPCFTSSLKLWKLAEHRQPWVVSTKGHQRCWTLYLSDNCGKLPRFLILRFNRGRSWPLWQPISLIERIFVKSLKIYFVILRLTRRYNFESKNIKLLLLLEPGATVWI